MSELFMPALSASPLSLRRSGLRWLCRPGDRVAARQPIAACYVGLDGAREGGLPPPFGDERHDLQVVLAPRAACTIDYRAGLSKGGYQDFIDGADWDEGLAVASAGPLQDSCELAPMVLAGRRGFESGEGRGGLLSGWHERVRGFWEGGGAGRFGTVLALGTCEQTGIFRGDDMAFLSWFARAPGPAQIVAVADERSVHSSAVILQHLRRTPGEAKAITETVNSWLGERMGGAQLESFGGLRPESRRGTSLGRWPEAQDLLFALHLMAEAVSTSPLLERGDLITRRGLAQSDPPDAIALTLGSEVAPHFRHRRTGWVIALHGFRFGSYIGPGVIEWLRRDFERMHRSVADVERDLGALADELRERTGAALLVQNLIASSAAERVSNYSWLGDAYAESIPVFATEANLMLTDLTRRPNVSMIDSDALAAEFGVRHCPDRFHASRELLEAQRGEFHRVLRERKIPGY